MELNASNAESLELRNLPTQLPFAAVSEAAIILIMAIVIVTIHFNIETEYGRVETLIIPLIVLTTGLAGALWAGPNAVGFIRNWRYVCVYSITIAMMIAIDICVRLALGGNLAMVFTSWAMLIGSASAINLFFTRIPWLNVRCWQNPESVAQFHPIALVIVLLIQIGQLWISVLGASLMVISVQLLARRIAICFITHLIARANYGSTAADQFLSNTTFEYSAIYAIANDDGQIVEPDPVIQTTIGKLLLSLPIFGGETMSAGRKSLTRVTDKLLFVEQMLAFSSPTMVVSHSCAIGHITFIRSMLNISGNPSERNPGLLERNTCLASVTAFAHGHPIG